MLSRRGKKLSRSGELKLTALLARKVNPIDFRPKLAESQTHLQTKSSIGSGDNCDSVLKAELLEDVCFWELGRGEEEIAEGRKMKRASAKERTLCMRRTSSRDDNSGVKKD